MKNMKNQKMIAKGVATVLCISMLLLLAACGNRDTESVAQKAARAAKEAAEEMKQEQAVQAKAEEEQAAKEAVSKEQESEAETETEAGAESETEPEEEAEAEQEPAETEKLPPYVVVKNPGLDYYMSDLVYSKLPSDPVSIHTIKRISKKANRITDEDEWLWDHEFVDCRLSSAEGYYIGTGPYSLRRFRDDDGNQFYPNKLEVYDEQFNTVVILDFSEFEYTNGIYNEFTQECVEYADTSPDGSILYVEMTHRTYASSNPENAYILAIDLETFDLLWKSASLVANAWNFVIVDDTIFSGYGFTDEPDFVYAINRYTGMIENSYDVKTGPDFLYQRDGKLYVRTYDTDYEYEIK